MLELYIIEQTNDVYSFILRQPLLYIIITSSRFQAPPLSGKIIFTFSRARNVSHYCSFNISSDLSNDISSQILTHVLIKRRKDNGTCSL